MTSLTPNISEGADEYGAKRLKLESEIDDNTNLQMFDGFKVDEILMENPENKVVFIHGHFEGDQEEAETKSAVVILEKKAFTENSVKGILSKQSETVCTLKNDIYHTLDVVPGKKYSGIKTTMIYPATEKHVNKYRAQEMFLVQETAEDYKNITKPYLEEDHFSIQWVYNILEKKKEADRIVFEDTDPEVGFILLPDIKWDRIRVEDLYLVSIVHKHGIKSIRDLNYKHLPLLKNILQKATEAIFKQFSVPSSKLRIYLHYQPSYYHLHVHFTHIRFQAPGSGVERAHLLTDVIDNIEENSDYYAKKSLTFVVRKQEKLYSLFNDAGRISE